VNMSVYDPTQPLRMKQIDLDGDGQGDACDPDKDDDGVANLEDCSPYNKEVAADWDKDGYCDDGCSVDQAAVESGGGDCSPCHWECERVAAMYGTDIFDADNCIARCRKDNCIVPDDPFCAPLDACDDVGTDCAPQAWHDCEQLYANDQADADRDGVGDKCEGLTAGSLTVKPSVTGLRAMDWFGGSALVTSQDEYDVAFRTWGGQRDDSSGHPRWTGLAVYWPDLRGTEHEGSGRLVPAR